MKIAIAGAGYVGLVTGVCLADFGHDVVCVGSEPDRVAALQNADAPVLVDLRNVYRHDEVTRHGFHYSSVGRPTGPGATA